MAPCINARVTITTLEKPYIVARSETSAGLLEERQTRVRNCLRLAYAAWKRDVFTDSMLDRLTSWGEPDDNLLACGPHPHFAVLPVAVVAYQHLIAIAQSPSKLPFLVSRPCG